MNEKEQEYGHVLSDVHVHTSYHLTPKSSFAVTRVRICIPNHAVGEPWKNGAVEHQYCNRCDVEPSGDKETRSNNNLKPGSIHLQINEEFSGDVVETYESKILEVCPYFLEDLEPKVQENVRGRKSVTDEVWHDEDGDLLLRRKKHQSLEDVHFLTIKHSLATGLDSVGEQIWNGAMLMSDFIIHNKAIFRNQSVLELGAGTGVTSIVAAMFASTIFCTDVGDNVLQIARDNCERNALTYPDSHQIIVRELDWFKDLSDGRAQSEFCLSESEQEVVKNIPIMMAADVVYDIDATAAFFKTIKHLMSQPQEKTLYIALEKRLIFTVSDLDIASPGYEHFRECLDILQSHDDLNGPQFHYEQLPSTFPQYLNYTRSKYLELWKVTSRFPKT